MGDGEDDEPLGEVAFGGEEFADAETHEREGEEDADENLAAAAEQPRGRFYADDRVVFLVLMRIDRVIGERPQDAAQINPERR